MTSHNAATDHMRHPWWCSADQRCTATQGGEHRSITESWHTDDGHQLTATRIRTAEGHDRVELGIVAQLHPHPSVAEQQSRHLVFHTSQAIETALELDTDCLQRKEHKP